MVKKKNKIEGEESSNWRERSWERDQFSNIERLRKGAILFLSSFYICNTGHTCMEWILKSEPLKCFGFDDNFDKKGLNAVWV